MARVLDQTRWNISRAAEILGINRTTLYNKIRQHGLGGRPGGPRQNAAGARLLRPPLPGVLVTGPEPK